MDCVNHCSLSDGVARKYFSKHGSFSDGQHGGRAGTYCLPTAAAIWNERTSIAIYDPVGAHWTCRPQTRAFVGVGGNMIVACNGRLLDRATGRVWRDYIDHTLTFVNIERLDDGTYRFVCPPGLLDEQGNPLLVAPFDRFALVKNQCVRSVSNADEEALQNFSSGRCKCKTSRNDYVDSVSKSASEPPQCLPRSIGFDGVTFETRVSQSACLALWDAPSQFNDHHEERMTAQQKLHLCGRNHNEKIDSLVPSVSNVYAQVLPEPYHLVWHFLKLLPPGKGKYE